MDDDPFNWDVDRVVQELCSLDRTWVPSLELPPAQQLEAYLREQEADGQTILTYPDESELYDSLGIKSPKHKNTFKHVRCELRRRSQLYQHYLSNRFDWKNNTTVPQSQYPAAPTVASSAPKGSWGLYNPGRLPTRLEKQPREHGIDDHQLINEINNVQQQDVFFEPMRVTKFDQKRCLLDGKEKLQAATEVLETIPAREQSSTEGKRTRDAGQEPSITGLESTPTAKGCKLLLEGLLTTVRDPSQRAQQQVGYLQDSGLHNHEILHGADSNPATDDNIRGFSFCTEGSVHLGHQRQVRRLLQRKELMHSAAIAPACRRRSLPADVIMPLHHPFEDEVLPLYGDAEEDYDMGVWDEIEKKRREDEQQVSLTRGLSTDTVNTALDNVVHSWELQWREAKSPTLRYKAPAMWRELHGGLGISTRRKLSREQHRLEKRICEIRKAMVEAGPWYTERELCRHAANLRPSIHDYLKICWALDLARQESEPEEVARPPARQKIRTDNAHDNDDTGTGEELESETDDDKPTTTA